MQDLYLLAINLTERCNLACGHCYMNAQRHPAASPDELRLDEVCKLLDQVAARDNGTMVVLTGGEPLLRDDLEAIVGHGAGLGLAMVVGTNGTALTESRILALKQAGLMGAGISLDSLHAEYHDAFRGLAGSWRKTMAGIEGCRRLGLSFQLHFTVTDQNADELPAMIEFARAVGARVLNVFFLICTGRGERMSDISPQRYESILVYLVDIQSQYPDLIIRPRCAPHYKRIAYQRAPDALSNRIAGQAGDGCIAATHYCRIKTNGGVTVCPYVDDEVGNIRQQSFPDLWEHAEGFAQLRSPRLTGKCGACEFRQLCGGCRARPNSLGRSILAGDPWCSYQPQENPSLPPLIKPLQPAPPGTVQWSDAARQRLARAPGFLRRMIMQKAEAQAIEAGCQCITPEFLSAMIAKRFGGKAAVPPFVSASRTVATPCDDRPCNDSPFEEAQR